MATQVSSPAMRRTMSPSHSRPSSPSSPFPSHFKPQRASAAAAPVFNKDGRLSFHKSPSDLGRPESPRQLTFERSGSFGSAVGSVSRRSFAESPGSNHMKPQRASATMPPRPMTSQDPSSPRTGQPRTSSPGRFDRIGSNGSIERRNILNSPSKPQRSSTSIIPLRPIKDVAPSGTPRATIASQSIQEEQRNVLLTQLSGLIDEMDNLSNDMAVLASKILETLDGDHNAKAGRQSSSTSMILE